MQDTTKMMILCGLLIVWSIVLGITLLFKKKAFDCKSNPAIKCWNDWSCWKSEDTQTDETDQSQIIPAPGMLKFYNLTNDAGFSDVKGKLFARSNNPVQDGCIPGLGNVTSTSNPQFSPPEGKPCPPGSTQVGSSGDIVTCVANICK